MKIAFRSRHGIGLAVIPQIVGDHELKRWSNGTERDIDENAQVPVKTSATSPVRMAKAIDVMWMAGPDFVDAQTGINPDYECSVCRKETLDEYFTLAVGSETRRIPYEIDGKRVCPVDYLLTQPADSAAWVRHGAVEHSRPYDDARAELDRRRRADEGAVSGQASAPAPAVAPAAQVAPVTDRPVASTESEA